MPYKTDTVAIKCPFMDRRTKMLPCQKEMAIYWHSKGASINSIAKMFHVNKRLIQFILFPERKKKNLDDRRERGGWKIYYDRIENNQNQKEHRKYKYETLKDTVKK